MNIRTELEFHAVLADIMANREYELLDQVESAVWGWMEQDEEKEARINLINAIRELAESAMYEE